MPNPQKLPLAAAGLLALLAAPAGVLAQPSPGAPATSLDGPVQLPEVSVTAVDPQDPYAATLPAYAPTRSATGTKTDTPRLEVPQGTSVVTAGQARDQGSRTLADALRYEPGVTGFASGGVLDNIYVRGFNTDTRIFQDGLLRRFGSAPELLGLERLEILRGPGSVLYGQAPVGGIVSAISRRPTEDRIREVSLGAGTRDFYEGFLDLSGRLDADGALLGRIVAVARRGGTPTRLDGEDRDDRYYIAPSLTWRDDRTRITLLASYQHDDSYSLSNNGLPARGTVLSNPNGRLPRDRNWLEPGSDDVGRFRFDQYRIGWDAEHRFDDTFTLRQNAAYFRVIGDGINVLTGPLLPDLRRVTRTAVLGDQDITAIQADTRLDIRFATGPLRHLAVLGFDMLYRRDETIGTFGTLAPLDLYAPVYGARPVFARTPAIDQTVAQRQFGFYAQDQIRLPGRVTVTAGLRHDIVETEFRNRAARTTRETTEGATTVRVGATWEFAPGFAFYASYAESFLPQTGTTSAGRLADPERGRQYEAGIKAGTEGDRLTGGIAVFDIARTNVSVTDPTNPLLVRTTGRQHSTGVELEVGARPLPGLQLLANYTAFSTTITEDSNARLVGTRPVNVPNWQAAAWAIYDFDQASALAGLRIGAGIRHVGQRNGDQTAATLTVPAYTALDATVEYRFGDGWRTQLVGRNLTDRRYVSIAYSPTAVQYGEPLSVVARVLKSF